MKMIERIGDTCLKIKKLLQSTKQAIRDIPFLQCAILALVLNFVIEVLCRRSLVSAVAFTFTRPLYFLVGYALILFTLSLTLFFKKRVFAYILVSTLWLALGITNCVLILVRTAPFEAVDLAILRTGMGIITIYMEIWQIVLLACAILAVIALLILFGIKTKKREVKLRQSLIGLGVSATLVLVLLLPMNLAGAYPRAFSNLAQSYDSYGFPYCFTCSIFDRGVDRPKNYGRDTVENLIGEIDAIAPEKTDAAPNVIFLQLESFFDITLLETLGFSEDPIPFFRSLQEQYTSGRLTVPGIGAGTANTEFEVITGMSHHDFGTGEYPYKSFLKRKATEAVPFLLKQNGYTAHAIHNYTATFYDRNISYSGLGFDTFTPIEYMYDLEYNTLGWAKDKILTSQILNSLNSTKGKDVILTVSVQGHGKYAAAEDPEIIVTSDDRTQKELDSITYYVNQIAEMDAFLRELIAALEAYDEEIVLVMYGDHLPSLGFSEEDYAGGKTGKTSNLFKTDYIIWSNYGLPEEDRDLSAYQLAAYAMLNADISTGNIIRLHQAMMLSGVEEYGEKLRLIEYDIVNGKHFVYGGEMPYERTELKLGVLPITVSGASYDDGVITVTGENFTEWSTVYLRGKKCDTEYVSPTTLIVRKKAETGDTVAVRQIAKDGTKLGKLTEAVEIE
jgi:phosphoglycerol transferase MdoB-like AlkP superfamily enzyme